MLDDDDPPPRFTPTHVGKSNSARRFLRLSSVHPHARGEVGCHRVVPCLLGGSPPRTWGSRKRKHPKRSQSRFTPTHVGKSRPITDRSPLATVHPHARGEVVDETADLILTYGSPPRTWGSLYPFNSTMLDVRFTPTHVGKSVPVSVSASRQAVHPHARGEVGISEYPLTTFLRFTPTHVGKSLSLNNAAIRVPVHPHARGEVWPQAGLAILPHGSPPRTWGSPE